jgi:C1A family cysteine protease
MSTQCVNCNLQNSSSQYAINGNEGGGNTIQPPRRRYNPVASFSSGSSMGTSNVVNKIINVSQQNASTDSSSQSKSMSSKSNLATLQSIQKVIDVASEVIVVTDTAKKSNVKLATDYQQQQLLNKQIANLNSLKKASRAAEKASGTVSTSKTEKKKKVAYRNRNKSMGTSLASSPLFQAQLSLLAPIKIKPLEMDTKIKLPTSFDGRIVWKDYLTPIRNQGLCGSCYAFASVFVLETRLAIYSKGKYNYQLSPSKLIFCSNPIEVKDDDERSEQELIKEVMSKKLPFDYTTPQSLIRKNIMSCSGETLISSWQFLYRFGVPEDSCIGYGDNENAAAMNLTLTDVVEKSCVDVLGASLDKCMNNKKMFVHRAGGYYSVPKNEYEIRRDIYHWGPCSSGFVIYDDFLDWNGKGVYVWDKKSELVGGHAIVIMGWGEEGGKKYWIVRNSWGRDWGDKGYFKILRGENHCEIEENVFTGIPNIPSIRLYLEHPLYYQQEDYIYKYLWGLNDNGLKETTLELISSGKEAPSERFNKNLYDLSSFPNFSTYLAGREKEGFVVLEEWCEEHNIFSSWKLVVILILLLILIL